MGSSLITSLTFPEYPLKPRNPTASPLKRARFSDETDDEGDSKLVKKNKVRPLPILPIPDQVLTKIQAPSGTAMVEEISAMTKSNHKLLIPSE